MRRILAFSFFAAFFVACQAYDRGAYARLVDGSTLSDGAADAADRTDIATTDVAPDVGDDARLDAPTDAGCSSCTVLEQCCDGACTNTNTSTVHCGACGSPCPGTTCSGGTCTATCRIGFLDCDGNVVNGCEVNAGTDSTNCGACGRVCPTGRTCTAGTCACATGLGDCDGNVANGCEADLVSDRTNCGACNHTCAAGQACVAGTCTCTTGFADCDADATNGCETELQSDRLNCGTCGRSCGVNGVCTAGTCSCTEGFQRCPSTSPDCSTAVLDPANCGGCGTICPLTAPLCTTSGCSLACSAGQMICSGACVDVTADARHCGACGNACPVPANATATCTSGMCGSTCLAGFIDCDSDPTNGCEADSRTSNSNCGACGRTCGAGQSCVAGACVCGPGLRDCGGRCAACCGDADCNDGNGCTTDSCSSSGTCLNAGCASGTVCCAGLACRTCCGDSDCASAGGNRGCGTDGTCSTCASGFRNCDGADGNGCEVDVRSDTANCGSCGVSCSFANASALCAAGTCALGACATGYANCDGNAANGCETFLASSATNCGACGRACSASQVCTGGTCTAPMCAAGTGECDGNTSNGCETNVLTSVTNCGSCGVRCAYANASATCASGTCAIGPCNAGFGNCDGNASNGCETNLATSASNCGACGAACSLPHATATCGGSTCAIGTCASGYGNCDGVPSNGCEQPLNTVANCGGCNMACPTRANSTASCTSGICGFTCAAGWGNCDGDPSNGCETNLGSSASNCGACGTVCGGSTGMTGICTAGTCTLSCTADYGDCDGDPTNGCETYLNNAAANCGLCGRSCPMYPSSTYTCIGGSCAAVCSSYSFNGNCDGDLTNGCEQFTCTECNGGCPSGPNSNWNCSSYGSRPFCGLRCATGYGNCDGNGWTGCETSVNDDPDNCGACGTVCGSGRVCVAGVCATRCPTGATECSRWCVNLTTDRRNCGACGRACTDSQVCSSGACVAGPACAVGQSLCSGLCVALATDRTNCGACGNLCAAGESCQSGVCRPENAECANARAMPYTAGTYGIAGTTVHGTDSPGSCTTGPDVFYRFTLSRREIVSLDTFQSPASTNTVIGVYPGGCGTAAMCNDDACATQRSQWTGTLDAGTYYVVVETVGETTFNLQFQHLPVAGVGTPLAAGAFTLTGSTVGATHSPDGCGDGPDRWYYWTTCPTDAGGTLNASTCGGASYDTVLQLRNGIGGGGGCVNDSCGSQSNMIAVVPAGSGLHVLYVDGRSASDAGDFVVRGTRP